MLAFSLETIIPIAGSMHILMGLGMIVERAFLVRFGFMRSDDFVTSAADVLFSVADHEVLLYFSYVRIINTSSKLVNPSENVFPQLKGCTVTSRSRTFEE